MPACGCAFGLDPSGALRAPRSGLQAGTGLSAPIDIREPLTGEGILDPAEAATVTVASCAAMSKEPAAISAQAGEGVDVSLDFDIVSPKLGP